MATLVRFESAHDRVSASEMRACFHDEALIESVASEGRPLGPDATVTALEAALTDHIYYIGDWRYEEIAPEVILSITGAATSPGPFDDERPNRLPGHQRP